MKSTDPAFTTNRRSAPRLWTIAKLALILGVVWALTVSPKPLVTVGPQQTVRSINPKMGVHTRLTDEVEEWKIKRTLEMVREMGARWIVEYFPWAYAEPNRPGQYDVVARDRSSTTPGPGAHGCGSARLCAAWARPKETSRPLSRRDHYDGFGNYVYDFRQTLSQ